MASNSDCASAPAASTAENAQAVLARSGPSKVWIFAMASTAMALNMEGAWMAARANASTIFPVSRAVKAASLSSVAAARTSKRSAFSIFEAAKAAANSANSRGPKPFNFLGTSAAMAENSAGGARPEDAYTPARSARSWGLSEGSLLRYRCAALSKSVGAGMPASSKPRRILVRSRASKSCSLDSTSKAMAPKSGAFLLPLVACAQTMVEIRFGAKEASLCFLICSEADLKTVGAGTPACAYAQRTFEISTCLKSRFGNSNATASKSGFDSMPAWENAQTRFATSCGRNLPSFFKLSTATAWNNSGAPTPALPNDQATFAKPVGWKRAIFFVASKAMESKSEGAGTPCLA
mmetsp:Transcript_17017/g.57513  ORF Transcript_17017/g.57513 Transcript_17017/m.57513 type:complete len:350 (+) Transcript_17017:202-1251(+)